MGRIMIAGNIEHLNLKSIVIFLSILSIFTSTVAFSDENVTMSSGKIVTLHDNGTYTVVEDQTSNHYRKLDYSDFMIDGGSLNGEKIRIDGPLGTFDSAKKKFPVGQLYGEYTALGPYIKVETHKLSREDLKYVHKNCHVDCFVSISGTAMKDKYGDGAHIVADSIKAKN
jgi:hypothetical protein